MGLALKDIAGVKLTRISTHDFELLCKENPLHYEKTELLEGVILDRITKSNEHNYYAEELNRALQNILPEGFFIRRESSIQFQDSDLEPDIACSAAQIKITNIKNQQPQD